MISKVESRPRNSDLWKMLLHNVEYATSIDVKQSKLSSEKNLKSFYSSFFALGKVLIAIKYTLRKQQQSLFQRVKSLK